MKENVVMSKSFSFAIRMVNMYRVLCGRKEYVLSKQLLRSGTAIGALLREAEHAQSMADFINKLSVALKEANEAEYWILLLHKTRYISNREFESVIVDCREIVRLLISIVKTSKQKIRKLE